MNETSRSDLNAFFDPCNVAVFGSLREIPGTAYWVVRNMLHFGFRGDIYPINPDPSKYGEVLGLKSYADINEVGEAVDLAVVITPPPTIPEIVQKCATGGVKAAIVLSEGFTEAGEGGAELQRQLTEISRSTGIRIMGPNTFGVVNTANGLVTVPPYTDTERIERGGIAVCGQTGSIGPHQIPLEDWAYPVSKMCDIGNKCDVNEVDILNYLATDPETKVVAMHLEDVREGEGFIEAARRLTSVKPLVILKTGRSEAGARASASHTGSIVGTDRIYEIALRQAGAIRVNNWQELFEVPRTLLLQPLPAGNRFAVITLTGGQGVIAADSASASGLAVARFSPETTRNLSALSPRLGGNPVDLGPAMSDSRTMSSPNPFAAYGEALSLVLDDANVDCVTVVFACGRQTVPLFPMIVDMLSKSTVGHAKTVNVFLYGTNLSALQEMSRRLQAQGLPAYLDLDLAIRSLGYAAYYSRVKASLDESRLLCV
ncbi:MAG: CoA-binding protein [Dehalococcoidia bacterium]|nr:CoA-binding protein [Dehalococcoidia bacterium]